MKRLLLAAAAFLLPGAAYAACPPVPFIFANGSPFDANKANQDWAALRTCINAITPDASDHKTFTWPSASFEEETSVVVNGPYPTAAQLSPGIAGFASKMVVPITATQTPHPNSPITAWIKSSNQTSGNSSTAYFGGSFTGADGANPYGMTLTACNCDGFGAAPGTGHEFQNLIGYEIDMEVLSRPGIVAPTGQAVAYLAITASDIQPAGGSIGYKAFDGGTAGGFSYAFYSEDGAGLVGGLRLGAATRSSDTADSNGQKIEFRARTAGVTETANLQYQQGGNFVFTPGTPGGVLSITGHYGSNAPDVTVTSCGTSPVKGVSNSTRGLITVGSIGPTILCTVTFSVPYAAQPSCVVSSADPSVAAGIDSLTVNLLRVSFSADATGVNFTYMCMQ